MLDKGLGVQQIRDLAGVAGAHWDYAKIAWGSALITGNLDDKLETYRSEGIAPLCGGTLFEYCHLRGRADELLAVCRERKLHVEISDGVVEMTRAEKLGWIEKFAANGEVFSEVGAKGAPQDLDWEEQIRTELAAGATRVVLEGRQIGPVGGEVREDLVERLVDSFPPELLVFESLERFQQVWLIKHLGPNVNLANILPKDLLTLESFRLGLKEHTLLHFANSSGAADR